MKRSPTESDERNPWNQTHHILPRNGAEAAHHAAAVDNDHCGAGILFDPTSEGGPEGCHE